VYVALRGTTAGLASVCVAHGNTVTILHASAAVGDARYERVGSGWAKRSDFEWALRESPRDGPTDAQKAQFLASKGWLATAAPRGSTEREFQIRAADIDALGVTHLSTDEPLTVHHWPADMNDDCRSVRLPQGFLPETASFQPESWHRVSR
jgi:hypothetical protein